MPRKKKDDPGIGHNGGPALADADIGAVIARLVPRIEALAAERDSISDDIKDLYAEAKSAGVNVKTLRKAIAIRKAEREKDEAWDELVSELEIYLAAADKTAS